MRRGAQHVSNVLAQLMARRGFARQQGAAACQEAWGRAAGPLAARYTGSERTRDEIVEALVAEGLTISTGMSPANNLLRTEMISKKKYYPLTDEVPAFWRDTAYDPDSCPNVDELQRTVIRLPIDQRYTDRDIDETIAGIRKVWEHYMG